MNEIKIEIRNLKAIMKKIKALESAGEKAVGYTVKDIKKRAESWVAQEVVNTYNINKKEIIPGSVRKGKDGTTEAVKQAGEIRIRGDTIESMVLVYSGRPSTPLHFSMTPKVPTPLRDNYRRTPTKATTLRGGAIKGSAFAMVKTRKPYEVKATFKKGKQEVIEGKPRHEMPVFLAKGAHGAGYLPFQRKANGKLYGVKTISVPQMVDNPEVNARIYDRLREESEKRLRNNMKRFMKV